MGRRWPGVKPRTTQVELPGSDHWAATTTNQADPHNHMVWETWLDSARYPRESDGGGYPRESDGAGYPRESDGAGYPRESDSAGYPRESDGAGYPRENDGARYPRESDSAGYPRESTKGKGVRLTALISVQVINPV